VKLTMTRFRRPDVNRHGGITKCLDCDRLPNGCTRERCRQHAEKYGHRVEYIVEDVTTYGPGGA
jgi:hypothetical protein